MGLEGLLSLALGLDETEVVPMFRGGQMLSDCLWSSPSCLWLSVERFSCDLPRLEVDGQYFSSGSPLKSPVCLEMEGCSCSTETVLLCKVAFIGMLVFILFSDSVSVKIEK